MEVTFNFLEIRAMNTYPEHQVTHSWGFPVWTSRLLNAPLLINCFCVCVCVYTGRHRHRQDHLLAATADPGPAGSHGWPHQLRPLTSLQQLHLCVSFSEHPRLEQSNGSSFFLCVSCLRGEHELADVNGTRRVRWHNVAASLWCSSPLRHRSAFLSFRSLLSTPFCVTGDTAINGIKSTS